MLYFNNESSHTEHFPCGLIIKDFIPKEYLNLLYKDLEKAVWVPALVDRYRGNELIRREHDPKRSSALVTKNFTFSSTFFERKKIAFNFKRINSSEISD